MKTMRSADVSREEPRTTPSAEASKNMLLYFQMAFSYKLAGVGWGNEGEEGCSKKYFSFFFIFFPI